jgi:hypothetical protein
MVSKTSLVQPVQQNQNERPYKVIAVNLETYKSLKSLGQMHDTFNDVINRLLSEHNNELNPNQKEGALPAHLTETLVTAEGNSNHDNSK